MDDAVKKALLLARPPRRPSREQLLTDEATNRYPFIKKFNPVVSLNPSHPNPGGWVAETFRAGNKGYEGYDRPASAPLDSTAIEIYKPDRMSANDIAAEFLHVDPRANETRQNLMPTFDDRQRQILREQGDYAPWPGLSEQDRMRNVTDALMRGYVMGQWPKEALDEFKFTDEQRRYLDDLKNYTTHDPGSMDHEQFNHNEFSTGGIMKDDSINNALRLAKQGSAANYKSQRPESVQMGIDPIHSAALDLINEFDSMFGDAEEMAKGGKAIRRPQPPVEAVPSEPEVGSDEYWANRDKVYSLPESQRGGPDDPRRLITPEEYRKGNIGRKEYVLSAGGRAGYATGGGQTVATARPTTTARTLSTGTTGGTTPTTPAADPSAVNYVTSVYQNLTGKVPDRGIINSLASDLSAGNLWTGDIVQQVAATPEFQNIYKTDPTNATKSIVTTLYGREPRNTDNYWIVRAANNKMPSDELLSKMMDANEGKYAQEVANIYRDYTGTIPNPQQLSKGISLYPTSSDYDSFIRKAFPETTTGGTQVAGGVSSFTPSAQTLAKTLGTYAHNVYQGLDNAVKDALPGLIGQESGGTKNPWLAKAKTSSASGLFQFTDATWISQFAKLFGEKIGLSAKEIRDWQTNFKRGKATPLQKQVLNMRTDTSPEGRAVTMAMGGMFNQDNANKLRKKGLPVNRTNLYSVHFTGDTKLAEEAAKNPNASISKGMTSKQLRSNRPYQGKTLGQVMNMMDTFFDPKTGKVARGQSLLDEYMTLVNNSQAFKPTTVDPGLVQPGTGGGTTPVPSPPTVPATGPATVVPEAAWGGQPQSSLTPAEILASQGAGSGAVGPSTPTFTGNTGGGGLPSGVGPAVGPVELYQPQQPGFNYNAPVWTPPSAQGGGGLDAGASGGGFAWGGGGGGLPTGVTGSVSVNPFFKSGGVVKPDGEDIENALRIARRKGGRINTRIDKDPTFDMSVDLARGGRRRYAVGGTQTATTNQTSQTPATQTSSSVVDNAIDLEKARRDGVLDRVREALMPVLRPPTPSDRIVLDMISTREGARDPNTVLQDYNGPGTGAVSRWLKENFNFNPGDVVNVTMDRLEEVMKKMVELTNRPPKGSGIDHVRGGGSSAMGQGQFVRNTLFGNSKSPGLIQQMVPADLVKYIKYSPELQQATTLKLFNDRVGDPSDPRGWNQGGLRSQWESFKKRPLTAAENNQIRNQISSVSEEDARIRNVYAQQDAEIRERNQQEAAARREQANREAVARREQLQRERDERKRIAEEQSRLRQEEQNRRVAEARERDRLASEEKRRQAEAWNNKVAEFKQKQAEQAAREQQAREDAARQQAEQARQQQEQAARDQLAREEQARQQFQQAGYENQQNQQNQQQGADPGLIGSPVLEPGASFGGGSYSGGSDAGGNYSSGTHTAPSHTGATHTAPTHTGGTHTAPTHTGGVSHTGGGTPHTSGSVSYGADYGGIAGTGISHGIGSGGHHTSAADPYFGHNYHFNPQTGQYMDIAQALHNDPAYDRAKGGLVQKALHLASGGRAGAWTRKEGKNPAGGLNAKGRASAKAEGHNLKPPAPHPKTDADSARRKSFCARMKGMKAKLTSSETANDPDSRINKSLRVWNCHSDGGAVDNALRIAKGGKIWDKPRPKSLGEPDALSKSQKASAKASAKAAGRPYPNLVDNMRAAQRKK